MIALEIPGDPLRTEVVLESQVKNLLDVGRRDLAGMASGDGLLPS
jgi:hypothetical protein